MIIRKNNFIQINNISIQDQSPVSANNFTTIFSNVSNNSLDRKFNNTNNLLQMSSEASMS